MHSPAANSLTYLAAVANFAPPLHFTTHELLCNMRGLLLATLLVPLATSFSPTFHVPSPLRSPLSLSMVPKLDSFSTILNSNIPPPATIEAIERSPSPLTAADLAALTGNSLQQSNADLVSLSSLSAATLSVSKDGDIIYKFPDNLKSAISASSTRAQLHDLSRKVKGPLTYVAKVSFGVVLLASLAAIFTTIFAISSSSSSDDDRRDNRRRRNQVRANWS